MSSGTSHSRILEAVIHSLTANQKLADRARYDEVVRMYFPDSAYRELMAVRELGSAEIREAAQRLY